MSLIPIKNELNNLKLKAYKEIDFSENPGYFGSVGGFFRSIATSLRFVLTEKENIVFALLQWGCIVLAYYIWVQVLSWIPEEIWEKAENRDSYNKYADLILWLWSLACVGLAAYPLGILTACMNASCILRFQNKESTFTDCFKIALKHSGTIWIFSWIDGWWTIKRIIERLPKKNNRTPASVRAYNEIIYQIWKMLTLGFVPALLFGRSFKEACQDSLNLAKKRFLPLIKLRLGYSLICWIVGIGCYIGTILFFAFLDDIPAKNDMYSFYKYAGIPMIIALLVIMLIFRPLYIISACRIYISYACDEGLKGTLPKKSSAYINILVIFAIFSALIYFTILFHHQLGIDAILQSL